MFLTNTERIDNHLSFLHLQKLEKQKKSCVNIILTHDFLVRMKGLEPSRLATLEPKSSASANSATSACEPLSRTVLSYSKSIICFCQYFL